MQDLRRVALVPRSLAEGRRTRATAAGPQPHNRGEMFSCPHCFARQLQLDCFTQGKVWKRYCDQASPETNSSLSQLSQGNSGMSPHADFLFAGRKVISYT